MLKTESQQVLGESSNEMYPPDRRSGGPTADDLSSLHSYSSSGYESIPRRGERTKPLSNQANDSSRIQISSLNPGQFFFSKKFLRLILISFMIFFFFF